MKEIEIKILGSTKITIDAKEITFPYEKVYILFIYLLINKRVSRDIVASLLWNDTELSEQRKNLRNALYILKKSTFNDLVLTPNRDILELNEEYNYNIDYLTFINNNKDNIDLTSFNTICKGLNLNKIGLASTFIMDLREKALEHFTNISFIKINDAIKNKKYLDAIDYLNSVIHHDQFNEKAYRLLIHVYYYNKDYDNAIKSFHEIEKKLKSVNKNCEKETIEIFEKVVARNKKNYQKNDDFFFKSKETELNILTEEYAKFDKYDLSTIVNITGNKNVGKSNLINYFLNHNISNDIYIVRYKCFEDNLDFPLMFIDYLVTELARKFNTLSFSEIYDTLQIKLDYSKSSNVKLYNDILELSEDLLLKLLNKHKIMIVLEDAHYLDSYSLKFLKKLIRNRSENLMLLISSSNYSIYSIEEINNNPYEASLMKKIQLNLLTKDDFATYYNEHKNQLSSDEISKITQISNADPFSLLQSSRLNEYSFTHNFELYEKINAQLDKNEMKILKLLSAYGREMSIILISRIAKMSEMKVQDILKTLTEFGLIECYYSSFGNLYFISSSRYMSYLYDNISAKDKLELHDMIASKIENETNYNVFFSRYYKYQFLIKHYSLAKNDIKTFEYNVKYHAVKDFFVCELFPLLDYSLDACIFNYDHTTNLNISWSGLENDVDTLIDKHSGNSIIVPSLTLYYIMKTRFYLKSSEFDQAYETLGELYDLDSSFLTTKQLLNINYLSFYYAVDTNNTDLMLQTLVRIKNNIKNIDNTEIRIKSSVNFYRLSGYYYIIINDVDNARKNLNYALKIYNDNANWIDEMFRASILHYIGQLALLEGKYEKAIEHLKGCYRLLFVDNVLQDAIIITKCLISISYYLNRNFRLAWTSCVEIEKIKKHQNFVLKDELINAYVDTVLYEKDTKNSSYSKFDKEIYSRIQKADIAR